MAAVLLMTACGDDDGSDASPTTSAESPDAEATSTSTTAADEQPDGPVADIAEELTGGDGMFLGAPEGRPFPDAYVESEYVASGTAQTASAPGELSGDGMWQLEPGPSADYRTRVVVPSG